MRRNADAPGAGVARCTPGVPPKQPRASFRERKTGPFPACSRDAGGGTRTPDTRIMIPLCFGSAAPFEGAGGP
jgi:hypothetical protein